MPVGLSFLASSRFQYGAEFIHRPSRSLEGVGVYAYLGNFKWRSFGQQRSQRIHLTLW